jgi:hypothetical protein
VEEWLLQRVDIPASMKTAEGLQQVHAKMMGSAQPWAHMVLTGRGANGS